ncbi:MAG: arsenite methyltransferase [Clostridia bacterium]|nr:arsenite methyltransferase [Clostridia bacterium]
MDLDLKSKIKEYYGGIASKVSESSQAGCCSSSSCCGEVSKSSILYHGENLSSLPKQAVDASLGCANPLLFAGLKEGEIVLDLGSGGGINVLMASKHVGKSGRVYGLDMTDEMLALANKNKVSMGVSNVEFLKGYIEDIPLPDKSIDVIMSNCVINLSDDKEKALSESYRVLKAGGRLAIADIVHLREIPAVLRQKTSMLCGCLGGTLRVEEYENILEKVGFKNIEVEPVHIYTKSLIESTFLKDKNLSKTVEGVNLDLLDGVFASAFIKAVK